MVIQISCGAAQYNTYINVSGGINMKELNHEETEKVAGGAASSNYDTVSFTLKVYHVDYWINDFSYMCFADEFISTFKRTSASHSCRGADPEKIRLYHPDGTEMVDGTFETNGIHDGDTIKAIYWD